MGREQFFAVALGLLTICCSFLRGATESFGGNIYGAVEKMNMRILFGVLLGVAVLSVPATPLSAAVTLGVQIVGATQPGWTGTAATVKNIGDTVTLQLYASIANRDDNNLDDAISLVKYGLQSTTSGSGLVQGNFSGLNFNPNGINATLSSVGAEFNGEDVGGVADPLSNSFWSGSNSVTANAEMTTGTNPYWGDGSNFAGSPNETDGSSLPTIFDLATIMWTATSNGPGSDTVKWALPIGSGNASNETMVSYIEDAGLNNPSPTETSDLLSSGSQIPPADLSLASGVTISALPEPVGIQFVGFSVAALALRLRRKNAYR